MTTPKIEIVRDGTEEARLTMGGTVIAETRRLRPNGFWVVLNPGRFVGIDPRGFLSVEDARDWCAAEIARDPRALKIREIVAKVAEEAEALMTSGEDLRMGESERFARNWCEFLGGVRAAQVALKAAQALAEEIAKGDAP